ncbi:MAG: hypothetical protein KatS3mg029_0923 [Saprospiraceae bacterium]|nr:MAG: hypothetical protein KatS3mg029_0923 [Saprospiraceae bacterium]
MKPHSTLIWVWLSLCLPFLATGQVKFKVKLLPDNSTYQVLLKPETTWNPPFNSVPSAQVTIVVPSGGFNVGTVTSLKGNWAHNDTITSPAENPGYRLHHIRPELSNHRHSIPAGARSSAIQFYQQRYVARVSSV